MDRFACMNTFVRVARLSSFTAAADDLGISKTLASRRVSELETTLGVKLLNRSTRSVSVTHAGAEYSDLCDRVLSSIRNGEEALSANNAALEGEIALLCPIWVGTFDVSEAITSFCIRYPKINIRLQFAEPSVNPHDFLDQGYDICIHPDHIRDSVVKVRKIGDVEYVMAASSRYLSRCGIPNGLRDLPKHDWISKTAELTWSFENGERFSKASLRFASNSFFSLCTAATAGLGLVMLPRRIASPDLRSGALLPVLPAFRPEPRPLYASYASGENLPRRVRELIIFLAAWFKERSAKGASGGQLDRAYAETRTSRRDRPTAPSME